MPGLWPEGGGGGFAADYKKASSRPPSFRPKRSGVEKSPSSDCTVSITVGDLSTQSIIGAVTVCPIPARSHAQDDGGGERPSRHFDRSGAEWRNLLPLMVRAALRRKISRLRASWERFLSSPIPTHTPARDDGGGGHPYRHFDRSGAEWRNLLPLMVRAALRREISRLRGSSERFRSISHTGTQPRSR